MRTSISRTELFAFIRALGGNPYQTRHVEIATDGIKVTTFRLDEQGRRMAAGDEIATDVSTIAIVGSDGDQDTVRMRHPNLDAEVDVPATAVGHHAVAGWEVADRYDQGGELPSGVSEVTNKSDKPEPVLTKEQMEQPAPDASDSEPAPRRRKTKESE